ncbi:MAG TPA: 1-phosphofructokinase [Desulfobacteria bacterium]|nr:1-phosphofructokinase [Desulfobacteria bacterium]
MNKQTPARIITLTLNPALDQTLYFPTFKVGEVNRVGEQRLDPGGKGINVAKVINNLGCAVGVTGFLGRDNANNFETYFQLHQIDNHFITLDGATRVNVKIVDRASGQVTELNFPGIKCRSSDLEQLKSVIGQFTTAAPIFVLSGSIPEGVPVGIYRELIETLNSYGCKVFLDTSGAALAEGIKGQPFAIKPNVNELGQLLGHPSAQGSDLMGDKEILDAVEDLLAARISKVIVSLGEQGALVADKTQRFLVRPPRVPVGSTVGAGDALVAGLVYGEALAWPLREQARWATAVAAASVSQPGTQAGSIEAVKELLSLTSIEELPR